MLSALQSQNLFIDVTRKSLSILSEDGTVSHHDIVIAPLTWTLLFQLVSHAPETLSIDRLIELCWENAVVSDETVVQRIALLRKNLEKYGIAPTVIENMRGVGYRWVPEVAEVKPPEEPFVTLPRVRKTRLIMWSTFLILFLLISLYHWKDMEILVTPGSDPTYVTKIRNTAVLTRPPYDNELLQQAHSYRKRFDAQSMQFAVSLYEKVLQQDPENVSALAGLTFALCHQVSKFNEEQNQHEKILSYAQKARQLAPNDPFVLQANGLARDIIGDIDGAIEFYTKAMDLNAGEPSLYGDLAYLYTIKGELALAAELHIQSLAGVQQFRQSQLALWLHLLGEGKSAGYWYEQAVLLNPHNLTDKLSYLDWLLKTSQYTRAIDYANQLQGQGTEAHGIEDHRLLLLLAKAYFLSSHQQKASDTIQAALKRQPDHAEGLLWHGIIQAPAQVFNEYDPVREFYSGQEYHWPEHLVSMAIHQYYSGENSSDQENQKVLQYLSGAIEKGFRDAGWLDVLVTKGVLPDTPKIRQLISEIESLRDSEKHKLEQNVDYQKLLNRTARAIVG